MQHQTHHDADEQLHKIDHHFPNCTARHSGRPVSRDIRHPWWHNATHGLLRQAMCALRMACLQPVCRQPPPHAATLGPCQLLHTAHHGGLSVTGACQPLGSKPPSHTLHGHDAHDNFQPTDRRAQTRRRQTAEKQSGFVLGCAMAFSGHRNATCMHLSGSLTWCNAV